MLSKVSLISFFFLFAIGTSLFVIEARPADAAATFTVNSVIDTPDFLAGDGFCDDGFGFCTLRAAIEESNALAGIDSIEFNIAPLNGNVKTIQPGSDYPAIVDQVSIDGYTQDTATPNTETSPDPFNGELLIEIDGSNANTGFRFEGGSSGSAGSSIRGLVINNFADNAIVIDSQDLTVQGNFIGTDPTGLIAQGNEVGINWEGVGDHDDGRDALIGGTSPSERNIISGNTNGSGASGSYPTNGWTFQGNYIGVGADGVTAVGNSTVGGSGAISIDVCSDVLIGGSAAGAANVISGNLSHGLAPDDVTSLTIQGNLIGTDYTGTVALGNGTGGTGAGITLRDVTGIIGGDTVAERNIIADHPGDGIYLNNIDGMLIQGNHIGTGITGSENFPNGQHGIAMNFGSNGNLIGGASSGESNLIRNSGQAGVWVSDNSDGTTDNSIIGNRIFDNDEIGIDLEPSYGETANDGGDADTGANDLLNYPVNATYQEIGGDTVIDFDIDVPSGDYRIEFFSNVTADGSGNGEGQTFIGSANIVSTGTGLQSFAYTVIGTTGITNLSLTTTEIIPLSSTGFGSTSEFSETAILILDTTVDTDLTKTLLNPDEVAVGANLVYEFSLINNGPTDVDMTSFPGDLLGANSLVLDILPPELLYVSENGADVICASAGLAVALGPALGSHSDHDLINCGYTGPQLILNTGDSFTFQMTVQVQPTSDLIFTNYAYSPANANDPDAADIITAFGSGQDIIDYLGGQNDNIASASFPLPQNEPTGPAAPINAGGKLPSTGFLIGGGLWIAVTLLLAGVFIARKYRKNRFLIR